MKVLLFAGIAFMAAQSAFAFQKSEEENEDRAAFMKANELAENHHYEKSLAAFQAFMNDYPGSRRKASAHFNVGLLQRILRRDSAAVKTFEDILNHDEYNELDSNNIMEPYTLYKHHSCVNLAEIYLSGRNYAKAAEYIDLFTDKYPYQHFCGNELTANEMYVARMRAEVYEGQGQTMKAIHTLLTYLPENGLASNDQVIALLKEILTRYYSTDQLRAEFTQALDNLKITGEKDETSAEVMLFGTPVTFGYFYPYRSEGRNMSAEDYKMAIRNNVLFARYAR